MKKKLASKIGFDLDIKYIKMKDIAENDKYNLSLSEVQDLIAQRNSNGLADAVKQIGIRYFIREYLFDEWYTENYKEIK